MAAERRGDVSPGREEGRSSAPSVPNNARGGAGAPDGNAGAELGAAATSTTSRGDRSTNVEEGGILCYKNGATYEGEVKDGNKRHGVGEYRYANGNIYFGEWKDGLKHGRGTFTYANGQVYEGGFKEGKMHGRGVCRYAEGVVYDGEWKDDKYHGTGTYHYADGAVYEGELKDGEQHGKGVYTFASGAVYDGELKEGKKHGSGTYRYEDGEVYEGQWVEGKRHGRGTIQDADGNVYDGEWRDDLRHGSGVNTLANGGVYDGQWVEGKEQGLGTLTCTNGDVYKGEFVDGQRHGRGTMEYTSGNVYEGQWVAGKKHGEGAIKYASGEICEGIWTDGKDTRNDDCEPGDGRKMRSQRSQQRRREVAKKTCENCGVDDYQYKLRVCSGCNLALYCSNACQKAASRSHRRICNISLQLPPRDADELRLLYHRDQLVDLDAGLRYGAKYMDNLKHLGISLSAMSEDDTVKLSEKRLSSLLRSKKGNLDSFLWLDGSTPVPGISKNGSVVWKELHGLKRLHLQSVHFDDVQPVCDIICQQTDTLMVLCLPHLGIDWSRAKCRRSMAQAISSCKHLVKLDLAQCLMTDSDLKVMLQDLPDLRQLNLAMLSGGGQHEFTDKTCGLIARKCPSLQALGLDNHDHLSVRGLRKIFEGCPHLRSFYTSTRKLSCKDVQSLLDIAPQLLHLSLTDDLGLSDGEVSGIIEATGGRTYIRFGPRPTLDSSNISAESLERYERQRVVILDAWRIGDDPDVANEWEELFEG